MLQDSSTSKVIITIKSSGALFRLRAISRLGILDGFPQVMIASRLQGALEEVVITPAVSVRIKWSFQTWGKLLEVWGITQYLANCRI